MSYSNLIRSLDKMEQCEGFDCGHPYDISVISKAEAILNCRFSKQLTHYLSKYGYIGFFGVELYGITKSDFQMKYWKAIWLNGLCMNVLYHGLIIYGYQFALRMTGTWRLWTTIP